MDVLYLYDIALCIGFGGLVCDDFIVSIWIISPISAIIFNIERNGCY